MSNIIDTQKILSVKRVNVSLEEQKKMKLMQEEHIRTKGIKMYGESFDEFKLVYETCKTVSDLCDMPSVEQKIQQQA